MKYFSPNENGTILGSSGRVRQGLPFTTAGSCLPAWPIRVLETTRSDARPQAVSSGTSKNVAAHPVAQLKQEDKLVTKPLQSMHRSLPPRTHTFHTIYDDNGNIVTTTDARNISITGTYDRFNRLTYRDYSDPATPDVTFYYDGRGLGSIPNHSKGKTTRVSSSVSETRNTSFDAMGRLLASQQITDGQTYSFGYAYNLSGVLIEETYPSGRVVKNTLNADGELTRVQSKKNANYGFFTYADSFTYNSAGAVTKMQLGNGHWETASFNERLQVTQIGLGLTDSTQNLLKLEFKYNTVGQTDNNGSMREQKITVPVVGSNPTFTATQTYTYDSLNRIESATENISSQTWKQTFSYDRFGNRRFDAAHTTTLGSCAQAVCNPTINTANNRFSTGQSYSYDATGSITQDATGQRFIYDAESHQKEFFSASNGTSTPDATYHYDGEGRRVKKIVGSEVTIFVYNASGQLAAEYSTQIETVNPKVSYLTTDHLGSPRVITDQNGAVTSRKDFAAFGDEVVSLQRVGGPSGNGYNPPNVRQDYTGYQKDGESGLEFAQARYYNNQHGRFTSIDPLTASATIRNPQTFNRYSYVTNSPYKFVDPLGLTLQDAGIYITGDSSLAGKYDRAWADRMRQQAQPPPPAQTTGRPCHFCAPKSQRSLPLPTDRPRFFTNNNNATRTISVTIDPSDPRMILDLNISPAGEKPRYVSGVGSELTITIKDENGTPISNARVQEFNVTDGDPKELLQNPNVIETNSDGQLTDYVMWVVGPPQSTKGVYGPSGQTADDLREYQNGTPFSRTTIQTLTVTTKVGVYEAVYRRTLSNLNSQGTINAQDNANGVSHRIQVTVPKITLIRKY